MALRVAVLRVDRDDQALEDVEGPRFGCGGALVVSGDPGRVTAAGLRLTERRRGHGQELGHG